jgi:hypothetical protein
MPHTHARTYIHIKKLALLWKTVEIEHPKEGCIMNIKVHFYIYLYMQSMQ